MVRKSDIFALPPPQNEIGLNKLVNSVFADMPHDQIWLLFPFRSTTIWCFRMSGKTMTLLDVQYLTQFNYCSCNC